MSVADYKGTTDRSSLSGNTEDSSDTLSKPWNLQAIHDFVDEEGLTDTLYCLPELDAYTFVDYRFCARLRKRQDALPRGR